MFASPEPPQYDIAQTLIQAVTNAGCFFILCVAVVAAIYLLTGGRSNPPDLIPQFSEKTAFSIDRKEIEPWPR